MRVIIGQLYSFRLTGSRALKAHFAALEERSDEIGVNEARGYACEFVAWQFVTNLSEREAIDYLLFELPPSSTPASSAAEVRPANGAGLNGASERTPLLPASQEEPNSYFGTDIVHAGITTTVPEADQFAAQFENLSALEIASVSNAKKFLSQRAIQRIVNGIWRVMTIHRTLPLSKTDRL